MRIAGRDYLLKILNRDYADSVLVTRKKYFCSGEPQELGRNSTLFFAMREVQSKDYNLVGEAKPAYVGPLSVRDRDEFNFVEEHNWRFVIELTDIRKYTTPISAAFVFPIEVIGKLHTQRPFGIELTPQQGRSARETISRIV